MTQHLLIFIITIAFVILWATVGFVIGWLARGFKESYTVYKLNRRISDLQFLLQDRIK